ncbi:MAG: ATP synthase F1 subunit delta [Lachnospiraceae bacterium]|nr:ATP synthase F1 subunit delta [Lachnospiraceae bacterium]
MTNQTISNYGQVLYELEIPQADIEGSVRLCGASPELLECLASPLISKQQKNQVIDRVFPESARNLMKVVCEHNEILHMQDILEAYELYAESQKGVLRAELIYVTPPNAKQKEKMESFIQKEYGADRVEIREKTDASLIGGFILRVGSQEYDWSTKGQLQSLGKKLAGK